MRHLKKILQIGIINTLRLNLAYFGISGVFCPIILASRHVRLSSLKGRVIAEDRHIGAIRIGLGHNGVIDGKSNRCTWENDGVIHFLGKASFQAGSSLVNCGCLTIGNNSTFNGRVSIICYESITIGQHVYCSWECQIMDTDFHKIIDMDTGARINSNKAIIIGDNVWIGTRSLILKGSIIPDNSIIAAGSILTKKMSEKNAVYSSDRVIRSGVEWLP